MSVPFLRDAIQAGETEKLIRFVRLHLGDGNEKAGKAEIDKSWAETIKVLVDYPEIDYETIEKTMRADDATLATLFYHLHFHFVKRSGDWIHDGSR